MLAKFGYNVVRLPRTGIEPLDVFGRDSKGNERLGQLTTIWRSANAAPKPEDGDVAGDIKTVTTATLKTSIGLRVLDNILSGLGATVPRLDFAYARKRTLQFSIGNIQLTKVSPFDVGKYLQAGDLQTGNPWVDRYFLDDDTEAFVITEVLKSDRVTVIASSDDSGSAGVDIKAIQDVVGADVKVEAAKSDQSEISYNGQRHLTFGFKAFQIGYDFDEGGVGSWYVMGVDPGKGKTFLAVTDGSGGKGASSTRGVLLAERDGRLGRVDLR